MLDGSMMSRVTAIAAISAMATAVISGAASASDGVGEAVAVADAASASGEVGARPLTGGSSVFAGDRVTTNGVGEAQLLFQDGTRMVVGPNSSLVIEESLFRGNATENKFAVRALGGAFRFISGDSGAKGFTIRTPSATICGAGGGCTGGDSVKR